MPEMFKKEQSDLLPLAGIGGALASDVVAVPLPEGDYEITRWAVMEGDVTFSSRLPIKVPFRVKAGETTYLGRMNYLSVSGKNIIGMPVPGKALVIISDEYQTDVARISKAYPSIRQSSIRKSNVSQVYRSEMKRILDTPSKYLGLF